MALDLLVSTIKAPESTIISSEKDNLLDIANTIKEGCDVSLGILNQLLTFEKLSAGMMQLEAKFVPLLTVVEENAAMFRFQARVCFCFLLLSTQFSFNHELFIHLYM